MRGLGRNAARALTMMCVGGMVSACAGAQPAQHLKFSEASHTGGQLDFTRPFVLEFEPGDRLPIHLEFTDQLFELQPAKPDLVLVAKRHGFVLIDGAHVVSSLRGDDFDVKPEEPGRFRFGLAITRQGSWIDAAVTTPRHAEPGGTAP
jgi:hypothetical protein